MKIISYIFLLSLLIQSCVKDISVDLPPYEPKLVVEGSIQPGTPPFVLISKSLDIFAPTSVSDLENNFITDATVYVSNGVDTILLELMCTDSLDPLLLPVVAELLGYSEAELQTLKICAYSTLNSAIFGIVGMNYDLKIIHDGETYTSSTRIKQPLPLDSIFWSERANLPGFGYMSATISDPFGPGDAYRWRSKRLNTYSDGTPKDETLLVPFNSSFDDQFFDGLQFTFFYDNPGSYDDSTMTDVQKGYYALGDTVVVQWSTINYDVYEFLRFQDIQVTNGGSPFSSPINIPSNISNDALGLWAGYSPTYDTIVCTN